MRKLKGQSASYTKIVLGAYYKSSEAEIEEKLIA
jgi:hypothetical protein